MIAGVSHFALFDAAELFVLLSGFNEHHKDFPGVIWIQPETLIAFITESPKLHPARRADAETHGHDHRQAVGFQLSFDLTGALTSNL